MSTPTKEELDEAIKRLRKTIDGQRFRLSQLHEACQWCVNQLIPFENMEAMGPLESFKLREIQTMLNPSPPTNQTDI